MKMEKKRVFVLVERWAEMNIGTETKNIGTIKAQNFATAARRLGASIKELIVDEAIIEFDYKRLIRSRKWTKERTENGIEFTRKGSNFGGISFSVFFNADTKEPLQVFKNGKKVVIYYLQKLPQL